VVDWHPRLFSDEYAYLSQKIIKDVTLYRIKSPATRLYLWLVVRQEEEASHNRFELKLTIQDVVKALDVDRSTVVRYRDRLQELGLLKISKNTCKPKY
jgi:predicted transcriptional regulator